MDIEPQIVEENNSKPDIEQPQNEEPVKNGE